VLRGEVKAQWIKTSSLNHRIQEKKNQPFLRLAFDKKIRIFIYEKNSTYHDITLGRCSFHRDFIGGLVDWKGFF